MKKIENYINGKIIKGTSGQYLPVDDPSTGEKIGEVILSNEDDCINLIENSAKAYEKWSQVTPLKRSRIISKYKELIEKNLDSIAKLVSLEHGKTLDDAKGSVTRGLEVVEFACGIPHLLKGDFSQNVGTEIDSWSIRQPIGVTAGITPFNFPAMVPMWMYPISIACGNSFILKPSERDPSCSLKLAELFSEAGLPDGVFNVLNGNKTAVDILLSDKRVQSVSFVGSTPVAKSVYELSAVSGKRCQALGGAKNHALILPDADIDYTTDQLISAAFGSSGQRCMALSVAVVFSSVKKRFLESLQNKVGKLKFGLDNLNSNSFGPLVSKEHLESVENYIQMSKEEGARILMDGRISLKRKNSTSGYFLGPTIIDNVKSNMKSYQNEIFGPVLQVIEVDEINEAIKLINKSKFGNGCCVFTSSGKNARSFSENVEIGMVGVNIPLPVPSSFHSFGGWKNSLFGDLNIYGPDGVRFYTRRKTVTQRWPSSGSSQGVDLSMPSNLKQ